MNVLLVRPRVLNLMTIVGAIVCEPLELEYLLPACREAGAEPFLYDGVVEAQRFSDVLRTVKPGLVAITGYLTQEKEMREYARLSKVLCPGCTVAIGGVHAQLNYGRLYWPEVDYVLRSESVVDFRRFVEALAQGESPRDIPGLCARHGEDFEETTYEPGDMDALPKPDRSSWQGTSFRYLHFQRLSTLKTAASCPFGCSFCYGRNLHGGIYQARALEGVLDELGELPGENVFIVDSDFLLDEIRVKAFADGVEARGIRKGYICYARADFISKHPDLIRRLCQVGFRAFLVGIEGIEDEKLGAWNKGTSLRVNEDCVRILRENGADCVALLLGDPAFRRVDFGRLYRWVRDHGLRYASVQILTPIPPTRFYQEK